MKRHLLIFLLIMVVAGGAEAVSLVLSTEISEPQPQDRFFCEGPIFAHLTFPKGQGGRHQIEGRWLKPDGSVQEKNTFELTLSPNRSQNAFLYLRFEQDGFFDDFGFGSYGSKNTEFDGQWNLEIYQDSVLAAQTNFHVTCH